MTPSAKPSVNQPNVYVASARENLPSVNQVCFKVQSHDFVCGSDTPIAQYPDTQHLSVTVTGSPYWTDPSLAQLAKETGHAFALMQAYEQHDLDCLNSLKGAFFIVIMDHKRQRCIAATDRLGQISVYYTHDSAGFVIANRASLVLSLSNADSAIREQGIYNYIYFHMVPAPETIYRGVRKLQAGHCLIATHNQLEVKRYWAPTFEEKPSDSIDALGNELRDILTRSVARALPGSASSTGSFLSGGLDSSSVTGALSSLGNYPAFSIGFAAEGYDEIEFARLTASHFGVSLNEYYVTPEDVVSALPLVATSYEEPFGNSSALPAYFCAKLAAKHGVDLLLAGDGGDELFAGNERYGKQLLFEYYQRLPGFLRRGLLEPLCFRLPDALPYASKARSYITQANIALPERLQTYNFLHQFDPDQLFQQDLLQEITRHEPKELQQDVYNTPKDASELNRMLFLDWQFTLADNDLRKVNHMCALAGIEVRYPMLDDELLEFACRIPSHWKLKSNLRDSNSGLRHFYKRSLSGWLPQRTIDKNKKGFGLPFGVWMRDHKPLQDMAYDTLTDIKQRHLFRPEFIDQAINQHRQGHAAYYGELIWVLMVLELWLAKHHQTLPQRDWEQVA